MRCMPSALVLGTENSIMIVSELLFAGLAEIAAVRGRLLTEERTS